MCRHVQSARNKRHDKAAQGKNIKKSIQYPASFPWEQKLRNHKILGKFWNIRKKKNFLNSVQLPHPSEETVWFPAVSKDQEKEFFEHEKTSFIRPAHFLLASCLPAQNDDKMTTGDGQTDCLRDVYWYSWHMWHLHFSDITNIWNLIHSLKLTSRPPKRGLPKQRSSLPLPSVFRCYVVRFREVAKSSS